MQLASHPGRRRTIRWFFHYHSFVLSSCTQIASDFSMKSKEICVFVSWGCHGILPPFLKSGREAGLSKKWLPSQAKLVFFVKSVSSALLCPPSNIKNRSNSF